MQQNKKSVAITLLITSLFIMTSFSGCLDIEAEMTEQEVGEGLTIDALGRISINPDMFGENLIYENGTLRSIDNIGGGDGYRSDSSIRQVVEAMIHGTLEFATRTITNNTDTSGGQIAVYNGDNVTYYSATGSNIIKAVNSLNGQPGRVNVPSGTFYPDSTIYLNTRQSLIGEGYRSTIISSNISDGSPIIQVNNSVYPGGSIKELMITSTDGKNTGEAVFLNSTYMYVIDHVRFWNLDDWAIRSNDSIATEVKACLFMRMDADHGGIYKTYGTSLNIYGCDFEGYNGTGIWLDGVYSSFIHDNWFENDDDRDANHINLTSTGRDCIYNQIYSNRFVKTGVSNDYAILLQDTVNDVEYNKIYNNVLNNAIVLNASHNQISENTIRSIPVGAKVQIGIDDNSGSNTIINNEFYFLSYDYAIHSVTSGGIIKGNKFHHSYGIYSQVHDKTISDNYFVTVYGTSAIYLYYSSENIISNNRIKNYHSNADSGIYLAGSNDNLISGNHITGTHVDINVTDNSNRNFITDNFLLDGGDSINITHVTCDDNVFSNNHYDGVIVDSGTNTTKADNIKP